MRYRSFSDSCIFLLAEAENISHGIVKRKQTHFLNEGFEVGRVV